ncbi:MAG: DinB family protein [bacterium]|jgi:hypothetical protein|nr:DinB family protein [bacterium]
MDARKMIEALRRQATWLEMVLEGVDEGQARWRPAEGHWSILDVACHLLDEEREDFRARLRQTLADPAGDWPPIDPRGWVEARAYAGRDLAEVAARWREERAASLAWLEQLAAPDWELEHTHRDGFSLRAGDLLAAWAAHDLLHLRQLTRLHLLWLRREAAPFVPDYAGPIA